MRRSIPRQPPKTFAKMTIEGEPPAKHSLTLSGHRTSVTLEAPFWREFRRMADRRGVSINALATEIDNARPSGTGLASAIRVFILQSALAAAAPEQ